MTVEEALTSDFWIAFKGACRTFNLLTVESFLDVYTTPNFLASYCAMKFGDIPLFKEVEDMTDVYRASVAIMEVGTALERIVDALTAEYNPLENYFTDREMTTGTESSLTKTGKDVTTPSGKAVVTDKGKMHQKGNNSDTVGQGTTYDSATTSASSSNDFYNISKTVNALDVTQESDAQDPRKRETTFENYKVEHSFDNRKDEGESSEEIEEHRSGNSGIFSKQDLTQREIDLRLKNRLVPIICRMVVSVFETGVYSSDN